MMIGLPGSGKSTWIGEFLKTHGNPHLIIASSDHYIEEVASARGQTYNEVFKESIKDAQNYVNQITDMAAQGGVDCIWDQTNLTKKVRASRLAKFKNYEKIAVFLHCDDVLEWHRRLGNRPGKTIPVGVLNVMITQMEPPSYDEGFTQIWDVES